MLLCQRVRSGLRAAAARDCQRVCSRKDGETLVGLSPRDETSEAKFSIIRFKISLMMLFPQGTPLISSSPLGVSDCHDCTKFVIIITLMKLCPSADVKMLLQQRVRHKLTAMRSAQRCLHLKLKACSAAARRQGLLCMQTVNCKFRNTVSWFSDRQCKKQH